MFRRTLQHQIRLHRRRLRYRGWDPDCGCSYQIYEANLMEPDQFARIPKSTWKRELKKLGYVATITYRYAWYQDLSWDHPYNRHVQVSIANWDMYGQPHEHEEEPPA